MERHEYVEACKARAREYLLAGDPAQAVTSMLSDMGKREDTRGIADKLGMLGILAAKSTREAERFIEGFR